VQILDGLELKMTNGLKIEVSREQFKSITDVNKKLDFIYEVLVTQKTDCSENVNKFEKQFEEYYDILEKTTKLPRRNRKIDVGVGAGAGLGAGTVGLAIADKLMTLIKSYISGG